MQFVKNEMELELALVYPIILEILTKDAGPSVFTILIVLQTEPASTINVMTHAPEPVDKTQIAKLLITHLHVLVFLDIREILSDFAI